MAKISKKRLNALCAALQDIERGNRFLMADDVLVCRKREQKTTTLDFTNDQGEICMSVNKEYGSELCMIQGGIKQLRRAILELMSLGETA